MLITTTNSLEGTPIKEYVGIVSGESIIGANAIKDFMANLTDFFGGRSSSYEKVIREAKAIATKEMEEQAESLGANAIIAVDFDYETVGQGGGMLMVVANGTAVKI